MTKVTLKAGTYHIGDLCYVLDKEWSEVCNLIIDGDVVKEGLFTLADGREFVIFGTAYGDGVYEDQYGFEYPVDSGTIGAVLLDSLSGEVQGKNYVFDNDFECSRDGAMLRFGLVEIDTAGTYYEDEDYYEEDEDESNQSSVSYNI